MQAAAALEQPQSCWALGDLFEAPCAVFGQDQRLCWNRSVSITCKSEMTKSQANNRPACETWAQILVWRLFFEFLGLAWITTSNLGASSSGEFPGLNEMGVFPSKQDFKGHERGRKVRLNANMYSFSNIYFFSPVSLQSISLAWIKSLTFWP